MSRSCVPQTNSAGRLELGQARVEAAAAERAGRGRCCAPRPGRRGARRRRRRCAGTRRRRCRPRSGRRASRVGEHAPELARRPCARVKRWGSSPNSGRRSAHDRVAAALDEGDGRTQQRERRRRARARRRPTSSADAAAHRVADEVGALDAQRVHHVDDRLGEPAARCRAPAAGLRGRAEAGQVERVDAVAAGVSAAAVSKNEALVAAEAVEQQDVGALAHASASRRGGPAGRRRGRAAAAGGRWAGGTGPRSRRRGRGRRGRRAGAAEKASMPRELALAQAQPGLGVGADDDVGPAAR